MPVWSTTSLGLLALVAPPAGWAVAVAVGHVSTGRKFSTSIFKIDLGLSFQTRSAHWVPAAGQQLLVGHLAEPEGSSPRWSSTGRASFYPLCKPAGFASSLRHQLVGEWGSWLGLDRVGTRLNRKDVLPLGLQNTTHLCLACRLSGKL